MDVDRLLERKLQGKLTEAEEIAFEQIDGASLYTEILEETHRFKDVNFSEKEGLESILPRLSATNKSSPWVINLKILYRIAAVFVIGIGAYFALFNETFTTFKTDIGQIKTIQLPDNSQVTLNALTTIEFDRDKWSENREVSLSGEALFKVTKGSTFKVITEDGTVTVIGTTFNVKQRENFFDVQCFEGNVLVENIFESANLKAGDSYRKLDTVSKKIKLNNSSPNWTKNATRFESVPMIEVFKELERQYDVKVNFNRLTTNPIFTGAFEHTDIDKALIAITEPLDLKYTIGPNNEIVVYE